MLRCRPRTLVSARPAQGQPMVATTQGKVTSLSLDSAYLRGASQRMRAAEHVKVSNVSAEAHLLRSVRRYRWLPRGPSMPQADGGPSRVRSTGDAARVYDHNWLRPLRSGATTCRRGSKLQVSGDFVRAERTGSDRFRMRDVLAGGPRASRSRRAGSERNEESTRNAFLERARILAR